MKVKSCENCESFGWLELKEIETELTYRICDFRFEVKLTAPPWARQAELYYEEEFSDILLQLDLFSQPVWDEASVLEIAKDCKLYCEKFKHG